MALDKLMERLRRARGRRKNHKGRSTGPELRDVAPAAPDLLDADPGTRREGEASRAEREGEDEGPAAPTKPGETLEEQLGNSPVVIRQKVHQTEPMTVDEALGEMELVGHPFFLFIDSETNQPCVVYHRHGWTYGVIRLSYTATPMESTVSV